MSDTQTDDWRDGPKPWWKDSPEGYEVLDEMLGECEDQRLYATYTPGNGIAIGILNQDNDEEWDGFWREFHLSAERAIVLGEALVRWGKANQNGRIRSAPAQERSNSPQPSMNESEQD